MKTSAIVPACTGWGTRPRLKRAARVDSSRRRERGERNPHLSGLGSRRGYCYASTEGEALPALSRFFRSALFPLIVIVLLVYLASQTLLPSEEEEQKVTYSQLKEQVEGTPESFQQIVFSPKGRSIEALKTNGDKLKVNYPSDQSQIEFEHLLEEEGILFDSKGTGSSALGSILRMLLPLLLIFGLFIFLMSRMQGGGGKVMSFGKSRAKRMAPDSPKITFKDVAGVDEAVEELHEITEFLENPKKFQALGARIPKGVLLYGPPGTGKTLLARSVAGEAGVPFFSI